MELLLEEALAGGAWGLSSGLFTAPGNFADAAEIHALARVLRRHGAAYSTHVRDEANHGFEAVREAIAVAEATGVHVQIAHLKLSGRRQLGRRRRLLDEIAAARHARAAGRLRRLSVRHRHQPVAEPAPPLGDGTRHPGDARAARPAATCARASRDDIARRGAHQLRAHPVLGRRARRHLAAPARERRPHAGRHRAEPRPRSARRRLPTTSWPTAGETRILITSMADADVHEITRAPWVTVGSDANALADLGRDQPGQAASALLRHPRAHARPLRPRSAAADARAAVAKMTGVAARALGLADRGLLRAGAWADVAVFDPARIARPRDLRRAAPLPGRCLHGRRQRPGRDRRRRPHGRAARPRDSSGQLTARPLRRRHGEPPDRRRRHGPATQDQASARAHPLVPPGETC